ncbi:D-alanyl-D-alanine carboxypeptidase [Candidatus Berkelbacteria bacterium]|nr:D-alanyl-D-alanine carboxypeptidase [Candidatus Berkelbacteria bacterium]
MFEITSKLSLKKFAVALAVMLILVKAGLLIKQRYIPNQTGAVKGARIEKLSLPNLALPPKTINRSQPNISTKFFALYSPESGYLVTGKDAEKPVPIASLTKMMTAIVVAQNMDVTKQITISRNAVSEIGSDAGLKIGETLSVEDGLKALLISSANDAAYALAENFQGGVQQFVTKMNETAVDLGLHDTEFKDPAGLDDGGHSTAKELAIIASYLLTNERLARIVGTSETDIYSTNYHLKHHLKNSNRLLQDELYYPGILGVKTGFTPEAGHSITVAATRDHHTLIAIILNTYLNTKDASAKEGARLLDWGFENLSWGS